MQDPLLTQPALLNRLHDAARADAERLATQLSGLFDAPSLAALTLPH